MSIGNAVIVAFFLLSHVSGITSTVHGFTQYATGSLVDVAHMCRFGLAMRTSNPGWYRDGMHFIAFNHFDQRWNKRNISWGIVRDSETVERHVVEGAAIAAFNKWSAVTQLRFNGPVEQPDIQIEFEWFQPNRAPTGEMRLCRSNFLTHGNILDDYGTRITINDGINWTDRYGFGHCLGLDHSDVRPAVMCYHHRGVHRRTTPPLHLDDILGIQDLYGPPRWQSQVRRSAASIPDRDRI